MEAEAKAKFDVYSEILREAEKLFRLGRESNDHDSIYIAQRTIEIYEPLMDALLRNHD